MGKLEVGEMLDNWNAMCKISAETLVLRNVFERSYRLIIREKADRNLRVLIL